MHYIDLELKEAPKLFQQSSHRERLCLSSQQVKQTLDGRRLSSHGSLLSAVWCLTEPFDGSCAYSSCSFSCLLNFALGSCCLSSTDFSTALGSCQGFWIIQILDPLSLIIVHGSISNPCHWASAVRCDFSHPDIRTHSDLADAMIDPAFEICGRTILLWLDASVMVKYFHNTLMARPVLTLFIGQQYYNGITE